MSLEAAESLPTLAYLMTDVAGSTRLWETQREAMPRAIALLDERCATAVREARGVLVRSRGEGDSHFAVFHSAEDAVAAAIALFTALRSDPELAAVRLRAGVHIGTADLWAGDYYGAVVNRCARIRESAHPGQILVSEAIHALAASTNRFAFKDLGVHRLRDLMQPERLFQVLDPALDRDFAPPNTLSELSHNLPSYLSSFVGRIEDLAELSEIVDANRLTTVMGAGGVGKTRLTQQVAADKVESFKDGAWFIDFAQTDRSESVLPILCKEIDPAMEATEARLLEALAHRDMLLILDNCEHLFEECRSIALTLLTHCPNLRILATSRRVLDVRGEYVYKLGGLKLPSPEQLQDAPQFDGIRLFVERAKQRGTMLLLDETSIPEVVELCRKLDGLPLAIEMAASLTDVLSIRQITRSIAECLEVPTGIGTDDARQYTISTTIEWSRRLLSPEGRRFLEQVAMFPNTWTMEAAQAVCLPGKGVAAAREAIRELVSHSLVFSTRTHRGDLRFGLLQTTRQVVSAQAGRQTDLVPQYLEFCRQVVHGALELLESGEEARSHETIDLEYETLMQGLELSFSMNPSLCAEIALGLRSYWMSGSRLPEGRDWYERLEGTEGIGSSVRVAIQIALSSLYILLGLNDPVQAVLLRAEKAVRPIGGLPLAKVVGNLAVHRDRMGRYLEAKAGFEECCRLCRECGAKRDEALSLLNLGVAKMRLQEPWDECSELFRQALVCAKSAGIVSMEAKAHSSLAHVAFREGRLTQALDSARESLELWLQDPIVPDMNPAMLDLAEMFVAGNRLDTAAKAIHIAERLEDLSHSPLPELHQQRLVSVRAEVKPFVEPNEWRSGQRLTRSKSVQELTTLAIQLIDS